MDIPYAAFDSFFSDHYETAYRLAFLLCKRPKASADMVFRALLALAAATPSTPENDAKLLFNGVVDECDRYYLKKPRRAPKRDQLAGSLPFPLSDALWLAMKKPFRHKAALYLHGVLHYEPREIAAALHMRESAVHKLLRAPGFDLQCAAEISLPDAQAQALLDSVYLRFAERNVPFELKLHKLKRKLDRVVLYVAAVILLFCIAAVIYTANLPVS